MSHTCTERNNKTASLLTLVVIGKRCLSGVKEVPAGSPQPGKAPACPHPHWSFCR